MKVIKKRYKIQIAKIVILGVTILTIVLVGLYLARNTLLNRVAAQRFQQMEQTYGLKIRYTSLKFESFNEILLQGLSVVPSNRDTLLTLQSIQVKLDFWKMISQNIEVQYVLLDGLTAQFVKKGNIANYDFLFTKKHTEQQTQKSEEKNYAQHANKLLNLVFGFLPGNGKLNNLQVTERKDNNFVAIQIPSLAIENHQFQSDIHVLEDTLAQHWITRGELNHTTHTVQAILLSGNQQALALPYITRRFGAEAAFDSLSFRLTHKRTDDQLYLNGEATVNGFTVFHKALSPEAIDLNRGKLDYCIRIGNQSFELDSTSTVTFNKLSFHPYLQAKKQSNKWHFTASIHKPWFPADDLFSSLPKGLFGNLEGIRTSGSLAYDFLLDVDFASLDSLKLISELKEKEFRILQYGATNLGKMSEEFSYTVYENGQPARTFPIGPSWPHFTPLDSISPILQMCAMQSEDGAFYYHRGFLPDAMREALIHDLKVRRFARGGSTISMQLVKNVFLTRKKHIARKLEEALIVWLIETERLTPKARMYEVYLNLIEWGPLVYGIREASQFYFNKRPSQLTTEESIFLASIIPKPKHFYHSFTDERRLKEHLAGYYQLLGERLVKKGAISQAEADSIRPNIHITGEADTILSSRATRPFR